MAGAFPSNLFGMLIIVAMLAGWLWGVVDAVRCPDYLFRSIGQNKVLWIMLQLFLFPLGTLLYLVVAWPSLRRHNLQAKGPAPALKIAKKADEKKPLVWQ